MHPVRWAALGLILLLLVAPALGRGTVTTIDTGSWNPYEMKNPVRLQPGIWSNSTFSNQIVLGPGSLQIDMDDRVTVRANLTINPTSGSWLWGPVNSSGDTVWWRNSLANVSYEDLDTMSKETIVLYSPVSSITWNLGLNVKPNALTLTTEGTDYLIRDDTYPEKWYRVPRPYVIDALGTRRNLSYSWNNGQKRLTLTPDYTGLTYPLTIDPLIVVDSYNLVGNWPILLENTSYVQIVYASSSYSVVKLAVNVSGTWQITNISAAVASPAGTQFPWAAMIDAASDLPMVMHSGAGSWSGARNFTYPNSGVFKTIWIETFAYGSGGNSFGAIMQGPSGRVISVFRNGSYGLFNISRIENLAAPEVNLTTFANPAETLQLIVSGAANTSHVLNVLWGQAGSSAGYINWTTITDSDNPSIVTMQSLAGLTNSSTTSSSTAGGIMSATVNSATGFPALVYVPRFNGTIPSTNAGRTLNYSEYNKTLERWTHEKAFENLTTIPNPTRITYTAISFNSSGNAYVVFQEYMGTGLPAASLRNIYLTHRITPGVWSTPEYIWSETLTYRPSLLIDSNDNIHIAWYNETTDDLNYYFEALAKEPPAGDVPDALFSCSATGAYHRNATLQCTDQSTNTPTTVDYWSPAGSSWEGQRSLFSGNITGEVGGVTNFFPHGPGGWFSVCMIASNAFGSDQTCTASRYWYVSKPGGPE
jgi:hypothetical protein